MLNYFLFFNMNQFIIRGIYAGRDPWWWGGGGILVLPDFFWEKKFEQREANKRENVTEEGRNKSENLS